MTHTDATKGNTAMGSSGLEKSDLYGPKIGEAASRALHSKSRFINGIAISSIEISDTATVYEVEVYCRNGITYLWREESIEDVLKLLNVLTAVGNAIQVNTPRKIKSIIR